jgi:hypothetical protein
MGAPGAVVRASDIVPIMYRSCIFCSAPLGSNESIERFPVGRSLAFDGEKGRLWAVCGRCARWNLSPVEERWEAIEEAERLFRDARLRVQRENIGLAKLRDGTRLVRIGRALAGELAAWRYGRTMLRRRGHYAASAGAVVVGTAAFTGSLLTGMVGAAALLWAGLGTYGAVRIGRPPIHRVPAGMLHREREVELEVGSLRESRFAFTPGGEVSLEVPLPHYELVAISYDSWRRGSVLLPAEQARTLLRRGMVRLNAAGASHDRIQAAVHLLSASGTAEGFLRRAAADHARMQDPAAPRWLRGARLLAIEMAAHEELERDALRGELAMLEAMWREAEKIAAIADRLPDVPAPEPPRLVSG